MSIEADSPGTLHRHNDFPCGCIETRPVDVWLPPLLPGAPERMPVVYMHDGQNLFDPALSYCGEVWAMDKAVTALAQAGRIPPAIIVGVWNCPRRLPEYMPQRPLEGSKPLRDKFGRISRLAAYSDDYVRFLAEELKPFIDRTYPTLPGRESTFVMGSSMGGLVSLYALESFPEVFGGAGCLSTHWPIGGNALVDALAQALPGPGSHKLYFDYGTKTLDRSYGPYQTRMDAYLARVGYSRGRDWLTRKFPGDEHNEIAWRRRVHIPLEFLLGNHIGEAPSPGIA
jgi:predicted alpha/beta superfamily hydrolase